MNRTIVGTESLNQIANTENDRKWAQTYENVKKRMTGSEYQKNAILRKRILKFFQNYKLQSDLYFIKRRDIVLNPTNVSKVSDNALLIYGIDFLPEERIRLYFEPFQVIIQFYDDSHCIVIFDNYKQLLEALYRKLINKPSTFQGLGSFFDNHQHEMVQWRQIDGYTEMMFERKLWVRFATEVDFQTKDLVVKRTMRDAFETAKCQFLDVLEHKSHVNRKLNHQSYELSDRKHLRQKKFGSKSDNKSQCCFRCTKKLQEYMRQNPCVHSQPTNSVKSQEIDGNFRSNYPRKNKERFLSYKNKPLPTISEKQRLNQKSIVKKDEMQESFQSDFKDQKGKDFLYNSMIEEFQKYNIKDEMSQIVNQSAESSMSRISFFEMDSDGKV